MKPEAFLMKTGGVADDDALTTRAAKLVRMKSKMERL